MKKIFRKLITSILFTSVLASSHLFAKESFKDHESEHEWFSFTYDSSKYLVENLKSGKTEYSPDNLAKIVSTPWVPANSKKQGIGEYITINCTNDEHLQLAFRNGFQSFDNKNIYYENNRAKEITITILNNGSTETVLLQDTQDTQVIDIRPLIANLSDYSLSIRFDIKEVYKGTKYNDLCIDSIRPYFEDSDVSETVTVTTLSCDTDYEMASKIHEFMSCKFLRYDNQKSKAYTGNTLKSIFNTLPQEYVSARYDSEKDELIITLPFQWETYYFNFAKSDGKVIIVEVTTSGMADTKTKRINASWERPNLHEEFYKDFVNKANTMITRYNNGNLFM